MFEKILVTPFQRFAKIETLSGLLLFFATVIALIWANSSFSESYQNLWQYKIGISSESFELSKPLILWVNDGLMAIFFFLIGLEIKREVMIGELNSVKKAISPLFAAIGGMAFPAILFLVLNQDIQTERGWGIPMAMDIAFSLAIIKLLGKRVPLSLKVFITAFAITDDIGAVLVIALFYSAGIQWNLILLSMFLLLVLAFLSYKKIYYKYFHLTLGIIIWFLFLKSGIHPTVAGVLLALTVPISRKIDFKTYQAKVCDIVDKIKESEPSDKPILSKQQIEEIDNLEDWTDKVQSPLQHLEHSLHNWVAYFIMPVFALANAGISFAGNFAIDYPLVINLAICLVVGNSIGVTLMTLLGNRLKLVELPDGVNRMQIFGMSFLAGVGFTMSIFIANLAFSNNESIINSAKIGIIAGSTISGIIGYLILRLSAVKSN